MFNVNKPLPLLESVFLGGKGSMPLQNIIVINPYPILIILMSQLSFLGASGVIFILFHFSLNIFYS